MRGGVALQSALPKILTSRCISLIDLCNHVATASLSAREGLRQEALNRAIAAASFGYAPSKAGLPNGLPAAAGQALPRLQPITNCL